MTAVPIQRQTSLDTGAILLMVLLTATWGLGQVAFKVAGEGFSPALQMVLRSGLASFLVWMWCLYRGVRLGEHDGTLWPGVFTGLLFGAEFLMIFFGLDYTTASRGVLFLYSMPFWVLIGAHFLLGERLTAMRFAGVCFAFFGLWLAFSDTASRPAPDAIIGDMMLLGGGFLWAMTTLVIRSTALATARPEKVLLYQLVVSTLMTVPLLAVAGPHVRDISLFPIVSLLFQAVIVVAITYQVWFWMIRKYPASSLSAFTFMTPVFGVLGGALLLSEPFSARILIALGLIAVGLVLVNRPARAKPARPA